MKSTQERFEEKFIKLGPDDCWIWTAGTHSHGYAGFQGRPAYIVSYEMYKGKIPKGLYILHKCPKGHNKLCVNPNHLEAGTPAENMKDRDEAGTTAKGSKNGMAKLDENDVAQIKAVLNIQNGVGAKLGRLFGLTPQNISAIKIGRSWPQVEPADEITINLDDLV